MNIKKRLAYNYIMTEEEQKQNRKQKEIKRRKRKKLFGIDTERATNEILEMLNII